MTVSSFLAWLVTGGSLLILLPMMLILVPAIILDWGWIYYRRLKPSADNPIETGNWSIKKSLQDNDATLQELGFKSVGTVRFPSALGNEQVWIYVNSSEDSTFAVIQSDLAGQIVRFITVFKNNACLITTYNGGTNILSDKLVINDIASNVIDAYEFHCEILETEQSRHGQIFTVTDLDTFLKWHTMYRQTHYDEAYVGGYKREMGSYLMWFMITCVVTGMGLFMLTNNNLQDWQAWLLIVVVTIMMWITIGSLNHLPQIMGVEKRMGKKKV